MINVPFSGHTNPTLPLTKKLVEMGHEVYYINAEEFRSKIELTGAKFLPYINYPKTPTMQQKKRRCFRAAYDTAMQLNKKFDVLIYEMFFYPGNKIAHNLGIPSVRQFSQSAWNKEIINSATRLFRISSKLIDIQVMGRKNAEYMRLSNKTLIQAVINVTPDLNIVYVPEAFQNKRGAFSNQYMFTIPIQETTDVAKEVIPYEKMKFPIVYISLGSIISNRLFYNKCVKVFGNQPLSVILNTGKISPKSLGKIPDNIYAYSYVPQIEVLKHTDVFVTHCGMNSVNEAICYGVPMVTIPFINDQISNAQRIIELGIGISGGSIFSRGEKLLDAVLEIINNNCYRTKMNQIQLEALHGMNMNVIIKKIEEII